MPLRTNNNGVVNEQVRLLELTALRATEQTGNPQTKQEPPTTGSYCKYQSDTAILVNTESGMVRVSQCFKGIQPMFC